MTRRIVQVGVSPSGIGTAWLRAIGESADWALVGVVDTSAEHRRVAADRTGLPPERCFATIGEAAGAVESDAIAIAAPSPLHAALCAEAPRAEERAVDIEETFF